MSIVITHTQFRLISPAFVDSISRDEMYQINEEGP
jgi:hypothetical protein